MTDVATFRRVFKRTVVAYLPYGLICFVVALGHLLGAFNPIDRLIMDASFKTFERAPSERLILVEFDPRSLESIGVWPWPRTIHAEAIERLLKAGALEIGYDVDFSSRSTVDADDALEHVLQEAQTRIILPAFRQRSATGQRAPILFETTPLPRFKDHVQLGSVTYIPAEDGLIRSMSVTTPWSGLSLPAMAALLAGPAALTAGTFYMDYGIDLDAIPRVSLIDLLQDRVPAEMFRGKNVIVGAGATELGDQHAVPLRTRIHGIEVQALAFESIVQGRTLDIVRPGFVVIVLCLLTLLIGARLEPLHWQASGAIGLTVIGGLIASSIVLQGMLPLIAPVGALIVLTAMIVTYSAYRDLWALATISFRQRMNLIHQRAFIQEILDNSFDGVVVTNESGHIVAHNDAAPQLLGARSTKLIGMQFDTLLPRGESFRLATAPVKNIVDAGEGKQVTIVQFDSETVAPYYLEFSRGQFARTSSRNNAAERRDIDRVFFTYTFRNVTERVNREIIQQREAERAHEENRAKSEVIATMSHELRTPLNAILGFSEILKLEALGPVGDAYDGYAENIYASGKHLLTLIDDILDVACVDSGRFVLNAKPTHLGPVLDQCMRIVEGMPEARTRNVALQIKDKLPILMADPRLILQCIINLLTNAIKYTAADDSITLVARLDARGDLVIEVVDTGIGVSPENLEMIRKPFYRVESSATRDDKGSVGLGLSLVDAYIRAHDGEVEISSQLNKGTTVRLIFPSSRFTEEEPTNTKTDTTPRPDNIVDFKRT